MTQSKHCLKCGASTAFSDEPPLACPTCGAVYSKVEQAWREGQPTRPQPTSRPASTTRQHRDADHHAFAARLREESIYPTFRAVVKIAYWLGVALAVLIVVGGIFTSFSTGAGAFIGGIVVGALVFVLAKVAKEMSLMLADLSDATVRSAAQADASRQSS